MSFNNEAFATSINKLVEVRLKSDVTYRGILAAVDNVISICLLSAVERIDGKDILQIGNMSINGVYVKTIREIDNMMSE